ncbi:hypothetical protein GYH30_017590 [Glycine max]|uniref:Uncharacterized protein n=1 Tax=Glycine max TaxID=3847 RepID=K7L002_SOYBN|nr:hypothetical protein JHK87_017656 [Glycine soja]KAH1085684.1 hypothetical protein GYH30_017590 [Glycine max]
MAAKACEMGCFDLRKIIVSSKMRLAIILLLILIFLRKIFEHIIRHFCLGYSHCCCCFGRGRGHFGVMLEREEGL